MAPLSEGPTMLDSEKLELSRARYRTVVIVCASMVITVPLLLIVARALWVSGDPPSGSISPVLFYALVALAATPMLTSRVIRQLLMWRGHADTPSFEAGLERLATAMIVSVAVWELPVVLGFVVFVLTGDWVVFGLFALVSLVGYALFFPRRAQWARLAEKVGQ